MPEVLESKELPMTYDELYEKGLVKIVVVDGLDGSGKGSSAMEIAETYSEEANCLVFHLPQYEMAWGRVVDHVLKVSDEGLSIDEKMRLYALNRLEVVEVIRKEVEKEAQKGLPVRLIFDRWSTSNIMTLAYFAEKEKMNLTTDELKKYYEGMMKMDKYFLERLHAQDTHVYIPMVSGSVAYDSLQKDTSREQLDSHEKPEIQDIAADLYEAAGYLYPDTFKVFSQFKDSGSRMTKEEVADYIINSEGGIKNSGKNGSVRDVVLNNVELSEKIKKEMEVLIGDSATLERLNPYKKP